MILVAYVFVVVGMVNADVIDNDERKTILIFIGVSMLWYRNARGKLLVETDRDGGLRLIWW